MKKILLYNDFPFHNEMFGFMLDYCRCKNYEAYVLFRHDHLKYFDFYKVFYKFNIVNEVNPEIYDMVVVLTDSDWSYEEKWINYKTICIDHWYQLRNKLIKHHVPISPFRNIYYKENFIIPTYDCINISEYKKMVKKITYIDIVILGRAHPDNYEELNFIKCGVQPTFHIVNCHGVHESLKNKPNVKVYDNKITTVELYNLLLNSEYILITDKNDSHTKGYSMSASIALSFNTGCQLIMPEEMNKYLRLKSAILYRKNQNLELSILPDYKLVEQEKFYFINIRNRILDNFFEKDFKV